MLNYFLFYNYKIKFSKSKEKNKLIFELANFNIELFKLIHI
jgi:hypothetical protein